MDVLDTGAKVLELQQEWERSRAFLAALEADMSDRRAGNEKPGTRPAVWALNEIDEDTITNTAFDAEDNNIAPSNTVHPHGRASFEAANGPRGRRGPRELSASQARRPSISHIDMKFELSDDSPLADDVAAAFRSAALAPRQPKPPPLQHAASFRQRGPPPVQRTRFVRAATFGSSPGASGDPAVMSGSVDTWLADLALRRGTPPTAAPYTAATTQPAAPSSQQSSFPSEPGGAAFKIMRRYSMDYEVTRGAPSLCPTVLGIAPRRKSIGSLGNEMAARAAGSGTGPGSGHGGGILASRCPDLSGGPEPGRSANSSLSGDKPSGGVITLGAGGDGCCTSSPPDDDHPLAETRSAPAGPATQPYGSHRLMAESAGPPPPPLEFQPVRADVIHGRLSSSPDALWLRSSSSGPAAAAGGSPRKGVGVGVGSGAASANGRPHSSVVRPWGAWGSAISDAGGSAGSANQSGTGSEAESGTCNPPGAGGGSRDAPPLESGAAARGASVVPRSPGEPAGVPLVPLVSLPRAIAQPPRFRAPQPPHPTPPPLALHHHYHHHHHQHRHQHHYQQSEQESEQQSEQQQSEQQSEQQQFLTGTVSGVTEVPAEPISPRDAAATAPWRLLKSVSLPRSSGSQQHYRLEDGRLQLHRQPQSQHSPAPPQQPPGSAHSTCPPVDQSGLVGSCCPIRTKSMNALRLRGIPEDLAAVPEVVETHGSVSPRGSESGSGGTHPFQRMRSGPLQTSSSLGGGGGGGGGGSTGRVGGRFGGHGGRELACGDGGPAAGLSGMRRAPRYSWGSDVFSSISEA